MENELDLLRFRLVIHGAVACLKRDNIDINEALAAQGKAHLLVTLETVETALLWMRRMIDDALIEEKV